MKVFPLMFRKKTQRIIIAVTLLSLLSVETLYPLQESVRKLRVGFLGVQFTNLEQTEQQVILNSLLNLLTKESTLEVIFPDEDEALSSEQLLHVLQEKEQAAAMARNLDVEYLYFGALANQSPDSRRALLVGEFRRFDRRTAASYSYEILSYQDRFYEDLLRIDDQLVKPIIPQPEEPFLKRYLPILILGGITLAGILALLLRPVKEGGSGEIPPPDPG